MRNDLKIKILYLTPCINGRGSKNPYIGMQGHVKDLCMKTKRFNLFTGTSWLLNIELCSCRFKTIG